MRSHYAPLVPLVEAADVVVAASMTSAPMDLSEKFGRTLYLVGFTPQGIPSVEHPALGWKGQRLPGWLNRLSHRLGAVGLQLVLGGLGEERQRLGLFKSGHH